MAKWPKNKKIIPNVRESKTINMIDEIIEFEKYREEILPVLRKALSNGMSSEDIYKKFQAYAAARAVSIAATEIDSSKALSAIKDILDRSGGKATEKREVTHKYEELSDRELDSMILSEALDDDEDKEKYN